MGRLLDRGRQGLISVQRYPGDFDGIVAGAPVLNFTDTVVAYAWTAKALREAPLTQAKVKAVAAAVLKQCDARDGLGDGLIEDPRKCGFDPERDIAKCAPMPVGTSSAADCLSDAESSTLKKIYGGPLVGGKPFFFGQPVGAEPIGADLFTGKPVTGWDFWIIAGPGPSRQFQYGETFIRYFAFPQQDPNADWLKVDFDKDNLRMERARRMLNATDPDLSAFQKRGGKMITYFGWADTALNPLMAIDYYEQAAAKSGPAIRDFYRLYMMPGVFHCRGGFGPDRLDAMTALIDWVERGTAPDTLLATKMEDGKVVRTRPLCPYPQVARYKGSGSVDAAASFECRAP